MFLLICNIILIITFLVYLYCLLFDVDPPEKDIEINSLFGAALAVGSALATINHEPTLEERLWKPVKVIFSKFIGKLALIVSAGMLLYYAYQVISWLIKGIWMIISSKPFLLTIGFFALAGSMYFLIRFILRLIEENKKKEIWLRNRSLEDEVREIASIPVPMGAVTDTNYDKTRQKLETFKADGENPLDISKSELFEKRLKLFYDLSIRAEAGSSTVFHSFKSALDESEKNGDVTILRSDMDEANILGNKTLNQEKTISKYKIDLEDDRVSPLYDELLSVADQDTSATGLFGLITLGQATSKSKVIRKTQQLKNLYDAACAEVTELKKVASGLNDILRYTRVCAYRNIFLGAELLNFIRDNAGGKTLKTVSDSINIDADLDIPVFSDKELSVDMIGLIGSSVKNTLVYYGTNKEAARKAIDDPKAAALEAGLNFIGDYFEKRAEVINNNLEQQQIILKKFPAIVDGYLDGKANTLRAIEIIRAIIKANKGFVKIYAPLRDKVFKGGVLPSKEEMQQLVIATSEYNKISKAEL